MNYSITELHWLVVVVGYIYKPPLLLVVEQAVGSGGYRMGYGLASSPISLALRARLSPKPIALAGHRHHSACTAYKLEQIQSKRDVIDQKIPSENPWLVKSLWCIDMIDYPRKTFKGLLGMLTRLIGAFLRMHVGLLDRYSPKIVRKVLRRAFYPLARKNVLALNQMASLARKTNEP